MQPLERKQTTVGNTKKIGNLQAKEKKGEEEV
jgi:hypothetical protein